MPDSSKSARISSFILSFVFFIAAFIIKSPCCGIAFIISRRLILSTAGGGLTRVDTRRNL
jgi:hypothetical protein